jgi:gliding motility-associated-like protein/uncharacterized repeat protein (TIGR01451 family)
MYSKLLATLSLILFLSSFQSVRGQNVLINYENSDSLFVCGVDTFFIELQNPGTLPVLNGVLTLTLPTGLAYVPGSVTGVLEQNIADVTKPVFSVPSVEAGVPLAVTVQITANCAAAEALDAGELFVAQISFSSAAGNLQISTTSIPVETGLVLITSVQDVLMTGEKGDTLMRTIRVTNTRLGKIGRVFLRDAYPANGMNIFDVANASTQNISAGAVSAQFDGVYLAQFGDGDEWLDLNETIDLVEKIAITDCGTPTIFNESRIQVGWGCDAQTECRYDSTLATVQIVPFTKIPNIKIEGNTKLTSNGCGNNPAQQTMKIINTGTGDGKNVQLTFVVTESLYNSMLAGSFTLTTNGQTEPITPNTFVLNPLVDCGVSNGYRSVTMLLKSVPALDTLSLSFDIVSCSNSCYEPKFYVRGTFFYVKECPVGNGISENFFLPVDTFFYDIAYGINTDIGACLESGKTYPYSVYLKSERNQDTEGFAVFTMQLPKGLTIDTASCGLSTTNGQLPALFTTTTVTQPADRQIVEMAFALPLPNDSMAIDFCIRYDCTPDMVTEGAALCASNQIEIIPVPTDTTCRDGLCRAKVLYQVGFTDSLVNIDCAFGKCDFFYVEVNSDCFDCTIDTISTCAPLEGSVNWSFDTYRLNLGYRDDNDDRAADDLTSPTLSLINRNRYIPGDTMRVVVQGTVQPGSPLISVLPRQIWHEVAQTDVQSGSGIYAVSQGQNLFTNADSIQWVNSYITVKYADGTTVGCALQDLYSVRDQGFYQFSAVNVLPSVITEQLISQSHCFVVDLEDAFLGGCLPRPFLGPGDAFTIYTDFKFNCNFIPLTGIFPEPVMIDFRTAVDIGENPQCLAALDIPFTRNQYSGVYFSRESNQIGIRPCSNSLTVKPYGMQIHLARPNMFPFEVRPLVSIASHRLTLPSGIQVAGANLFSLTLQNGFPSLPPQPLPFSQTAGFAEMDFIQVFQSPLDEGFNLTAGFIMEPNCYFARPDSSIQYTDYQYTGNLRRPALFLDTLFNPIGYFANVPRLYMDTLNNDLLSAERKFTYTFDIENMVAAQASNVWFGVVSPSGLITDFELSNTVGGQPIPFVNGVAQIGGLNSFAERKLTLRGLNFNCENDSLLLLYGFGCGVVNGLDDPNICSVDTLVLYIRLLNPELELDVIQESALGLCDTSDYFEFEVYNAKLGNAYDLNASVKLPAGLSIVPGTCQLAYPLGAPFVNISDPEILANNLYQWFIDTLQAQIGANGLLGVDKAPGNTFRIRFKVSSACGAVSNAQAIYGIRGAEPCGRPSNALNKPGKPINVNGLSAAYDVLIDLQAPTAVNCGSTQTIQVQLVTTGSPMSGDSVYITLPDGVTYLYYLPGSGPNPGPPFVTGNLLRLPMLPGAGVSSFGIEVQIEPFAACVDATIQVQARQRTDAFCPGINASCGVYIATGEALAVLSILRPQLEVFSAQGQQDANNNLDVQVVLGNQGNVPANGASASLVFDQNNNGQPDPGEPVVADLSTGELIGQGQTVVLSANVPFDADWLCRLLIVLPGAENCLCASVFVPLLNYATLPQNLFSCSIEPIQLSVDSLAGYAWAWQPASALSCSACAQTVFTPPPGTASGSTFVYNLLQTAADCNITHRFELTVGFEAEAKADNYVVCRGDVVTMTATPAGQTYIWQGPGIVQPAAQIQTLTPTQSATYSVNIISPNACTVLASIPIVVNQPDSVGLAGLVTCQGVPVDVNGVITDLPGVYCRKLVNANGCDSLICQPLSVLPSVATAESRTFCSGDTVMVFDTLLTQSGSVCRTYAAFNGCDSTHCISATAVPLPTVDQPDTFFMELGAELTLMAPDGFATYTWNPACGGCMDLLIQPDTAGFYLYGLTVTDGNGCTGNAAYRVVVSPPCDPSKLQIPNVFTPSDDNDVNDVFRLVPTESSARVVSLTIYSRWGQKLYEGSGPAAAWDGDSDGKPAPADVYVYILVVACAEKEERIVGDVTLLR